MCAVYVLCDVSVLTGQPVCCVCGVSLWWTVSPAQLPAEEEGGAQTLASREPPLQGRPLHQTPKGEAVVQGQDRLAPKHWRTGSVYPEGGEAAAEGHPGSRAALSGTQASQFPDSHSPHLFSDSYTVAGTVFLCIISVLTATLRSLFTGERADPSQEEPLGPVRNLPEQSPAGV